MNIAEIVDKPAKFNITKNDENSYHASAEIGDRVIQLKLKRWRVKDNDTRWGFDFSQESKDGDDESYELTGSGNEFQVFATAKAFLEDAIQKKKPDVVYFEADKTRGESRARLYNRFTQRWQPKGYKHRIIATFDDTDYHAFIEENYYKKVYPT